MAGAARVSRLYEHIYGLPESVTGEILSGQLHTEPRPAGPHAVAASVLGMCLGGPYHLGAGGPGGWWILVEPELHFVRDVEVLVPDLAGSRRERMPEIPGDQRFEVVPDWICEILSPATRSKDREIKMPLYARYGVTHAWLLDPETRVIEVYELRDGAWAQPVIFGADDTVAAAPFDVARFRVAELWS